MADAGSEASTLDLLRGIQAHGSAEGRSLTCALSGVGPAAPITIFTSFSFPNFLVFAVRFVGLLLTRRVMTGAWEKARGPDIMRAPRRRHAPLALVRVTPLARKHRRLPR